MDYSKKKEKRELSASVKIKKEMGYRTTKSVRPGGTRRRVYHQKKGRKKELYKGGLK